jgi:hypothetical protein
MKEAAGAVEQPESYQKLLQTLITSNRGLLKVVVDQIRA